MDIPSEVIDAVREATAAQMSDVTKAVSAAINAVRGLPEFEEYTTCLIDHAIQGLVYDARVNLTKQVAAQAAYTGEPKVNVGMSAAVQRVAASVYNHAIGGTRLGDLNGADLDALAESESAKAAGHQFNAALCRWCRSQGVTDEKRVRDVIPEKKLTAAYNRLRGKTAAMAAVA